jgi:tRNA 2-selenouridine synthase
MRARHLTHLPILALLPYSGHFARAVRCRGAALPRIAALPRTRLLASSSRSKPGLGELSSELLPLTGKPLWRVDISGGLDVGDWDVVCDARSPSEYADDHIPGSLNFAVLDDDERAEVGTLHAQASPFEARRRGAALVARQLHAILSSRALTELGNDARILCYCARGGERSRSLAYVLSRVGWNVGVVSGGYRSYRNMVRDSLGRLGEFEYHLISGPTGSAKGKMLDSLEALGAQVIDLEGLANHKGSILGDNPNSPQPSQKGFESLLCAKANALDTRRVVFVESESNLVGKLHVPPELFRRMQASPRVSLALPMAARVDWIRKGYVHFETTHVGALREALTKLTRLRGKQTVALWHELVDAGRWDEFVQSLLETHYDPAYAKSRDVFYGESEGAGTESAVPSVDGTVLELPNTWDDTYREAAARLIAAYDTPRRGGGAARVADDWTTRSHDAETAASGAESLQAHK